MPAGRPQHQPTDETRASVKALSSYGITQSRIAEYIGISENTLRLHYRDQIDNAELRANASVAGYLFKSASGQAIDEGATYAECNRAAMFWLKTRAQWRETTHIDNTSSDGSMSPPAAIQFVPYEPDSE